MTVLHIVRPIVRADIVEKINAAIASDNARRFKELSLKYITQNHDAFHTEEKRRGYLGASVIGDNCLRKVWFKFLWAKKVSYDGRLLRLFNRGHLEESRILAMLECIGVVVEPLNDGRQSGFKDAHRGGSVDGIIPPTEGISRNRTLLEGKTHNKKSFVDVVTKGVQVSKPLYYGQMQTYMHDMKLPSALYFGVCKDDDYIYIEEVTYNPQVATDLHNRAEQIIQAKEPPPRASNKVEGYICKYCDFKQICFADGNMDKNCRTCTESYACNDGTWSCAKPSTPVTIPEQVLIEGCKQWNQIPVAVYKD